MRASCACGEGSESGLVGVLGRGGLCGGVHHLIRAGLAAFVEAMFASGNLVIRQRKHLGIVTHPDA